MQIRIKPTQDDVECMIVVSWEPGEGGLEIGEEVLYPALSEEGIPSRKFPMFPDSVMLFTSPGRARRQLQKMQDALKVHPKTSGFLVEIKWSSPSWRKIIMGQVPPS